MFRYVCMIVVACLVLGASATPACAQTSETKEADAEQLREMQIQFLWGLIVLEEVALGECRRDYFGYAEAALEVSAPRPLGFDFAGAVYGMQLMAGQYSTWLTYSLYYMWEPLIQLENSYLDDAIDYVDGHIGYVNDMIDALTLVAFAVSDDTDWSGILENDYNNLMSLISALENCKDYFLFWYGGD